MSDSGSAAGLRGGVVVGVTEDSCDLLVGGDRITARYAPQFPTPHVERVSPANVVAVAVAPDGEAVVLWRWYDAVVLGHEPNDDVRLWEPAHGEVLATPRPAYRPVAVGTRAYASAGLPGADWWVVGPDVADLELDQVVSLYVDYGLWDNALATPDAATSS